MLTRKELVQAIEECEDSATSYRMCEKLATFYTIYDHLYSETGNVIEKIEEQVIGDYGDSDFLKAIQGMNADEVWLLMDELMNTLKVIQPRLYDGVMRQL